MAPSQSRLDGGRGTDFDVSRSRSLLNLTLSTIPPHSGREVERGESPERAGFLEIRCGDAQVVIVSDGAIHESIESVVVEAAPPCREGCAVR